MLNNSYRSLIGTGLTFILGFVAYLLGTAFSSNVLAFAVGMAILQGTIIAILLSLHFKRIRTNLVDYILWYVAMGFPVGIGLIMSQTLENGFVVSIYYSFALLLSVVIARIAAKAVMLLAKQQPSPKGVRA